MFPRRKLAGSTALRATPGGARECTAVLWQLDYLRHFFFAFDFFIHDCPLQHVVFSKDEAGAAGRLLLLPAAFDHADRTQPQPTPWGEAMAFGPRLPLAAFPFRCCNCFRQLAAPGAMPAARDAADAAALPKHLAAAAPAAAARGGGSAAARRFI